MIETFVQSGRIFVPYRSYYHTDFGLTENPISELAQWHHTDSDQAVMRTGGGFAYGNQSGTANPPYDDASAYLTGFGPNQRVTAVIRKTGTQPNFLEAEALLRWSEGAERSTAFGNSRCYGYEINLNSEGHYIQIGRFKETPSLFDSQSTSNPAPNGVSWTAITSLGVHDGDIYQVDIIGKRITARLNGTIIATADDANQFLWGNPGIGAFRQDSGGTVDPTAMCFKSVTIETLP